MDGLWCENTKKTKENNRKREGGSKTSNLQRVSRPNREKGRVTSK